MADNFREHWADEEQKSMDSYAHAKTVITEQHRMSHDGFMFHASGKITGITTGSNQDFLIDVPAGCFPHLQRFRVDVEAGDIDILMYEGPTITDNGTAVTTFTTNRNKTTSAAMDIYTGPTNSATGTLIHTNWVPPTGSGVGSSIGALDIENGEEWLLKANTKYLLRVTNGSGGTIAIRYEFMWYEIGYAI